VKSVHFARSYYTYKSQNTLVFQRSSLLFIIIHWM